MSKNKNRLNRFCATQPVKSEGVHSDDGDDGEHQLGDLKVDNSQGQALTGAGLTLT